MLKSAIVTILTLICVNYVSAKTIRVAVIDTGFNMNDNWDKVLKNNKLGLRKPKLCRTGHKDFTGTGLQDRVGHGTHIAGLIAKEAKNADYCLIILKIYSLAHMNGLGAVLSHKAFDYANRLGVDIINFSTNGEGLILPEYRAIKKVLDSGILLVVAAGNDGYKIDWHVSKVDVEYQYSTTDNYIINKYTVYYRDKKTNKITSVKPKQTSYPSAYDPRIIAVQNIDRKGKLLKSSNYGAIYTHKEMGDEVMSLLPNGKIGPMTGTSMSAAIKTGKIVNKWPKQ